MTNNKKVLIKSEKEMSKLASELVGGILDNPDVKYGAGKISKKATVITLQGELGAGKTVMVRALLRKMGVKAKITSPTFVLMKKYKLKKKFKEAYHVDAYRLDKGKELVDLGWEEIIDNPDNLVLIEWPERVKKVIPKKVIKIEFEYREKENERKVIIKGI